MKILPLLLFLTSCATPSPTCDELLHQTKEPVVLERSEQARLVEQQLPFALQKKSTCTLGDNQYAVMSVNPDSQRLQLLAKHCVLAVQNGTLTEKDAQICAFLEFLLTCANGGKAASGPFINEN